MAVPEDNTKQALDLQVSAKQALDLQVLFRAIARIGDEAFERFDSGDEAARDGIEEMIAVAEQGERLAQALNRALWQARFQLRAGDPLKGDKAEAADAPEPA